MPLCLVARQDMVRQGFTLIEVMIVTAILGILALIALPSFIAYRKTSQMNSCLANLKMLDNASESYLIKNNFSEDTEITMEMLCPMSGSESKAKYFIVYLPQCPNKGEYHYNKMKRRWYCSLGGDGNANGGFPHGDLAN